MGGDEARWAGGPALSVWIYDSPRGASAGKLRLARLSQRRAVVVLDAATVTWIRGAHRPRIGHSHPRTATSAEDRSPLEVLLGRLMWPAEGESEGGSDRFSALARELRATGLDEGFLRQLRESFVPDVSALVVLSLEADFEEVQTVVERGRARGDVRYLHVTLTNEQLSALELLAHAYARDG